MQQASRAAAVMPSSSHTEKGTAPSPAVNPVVASEARQIVPFRVRLIHDSLSPIADNETRKLILSASFLESFLIYRDTLPLTPGATPSNLPNDTATVNECAKRVYEMMDAMHICTYDRISSRAMALFTAEQHFECLIYRACRDLARPEALFHDFFKREYLRNKTDRAHAMNKIKGLIMVACNLILGYTVLPPDEVVREIEKVRPSKKPELSPIPEVRVKAKFDSMDVETLRKRVIETERNGRDEKEWLINKLMQKEAFASGRIETLKIEDKGKNQKRRSDDNANSEGDRTEKRMRVG